MKNVLRFYLKYILPPANPTLKPYYPTKSAVHFGQKIAVVPEGVEVVELHPLHEVERVLELLLRLTGEADDHIPGDRRVGRQLPTRKRGGIRPT